MLASLGLALLLLAAALVQRLWAGRARRLLFSALLLLNAGLLAAFVFSEDTDRADGTSRWDAYRSPGGALGGMFAASVASLALFAFVLAYSGLRDSPRLFRSAALARSVCSLFLVLPTVVGFSVN
jgi:hypothetical protein